MSDLAFRRLPWNLFVAAGIFMLAGCFLLYHLLVGALEDLSIWDGHWWQYLLAFSFLGLSTGIFLTSRVEFVVFSKANGVVTVTQHLPMWAYSEAVYRLQDIDETYILEKGRVTRFENTLRYYIILQLKSGKRLKTLETQNLRAIRTKATTIRSYLSLPGDPVLVKYR